MSFLSFEWLPQFDGFFVQLWLKKSKETSGSTTHENAEILLEISQQKSRLSCILNETKIYFDSALFK